jgi:predicted esterase YcpF (UPF0227 family)
MILYLHGFRSSPKSFKARVLAERMQKLGRGAEYLCPQLPASPRQAIALASTLVQQAGAGHINLIGSSLGGFYATWLAEQFGVRAVLLNPAVTPPRDLEKYVGVTTAFHSDEPFEFKREYVDELKEFSIKKITRPERYFLIAATGDEVLDWHEMTEHYQGAQQRIISGGDHALSDFEKYADDVLTFCGISGGNTH